MLLLLKVAPCLVATTLMATWDVGLRSEIRASSDPAGDGRQLSGAAELSPSGGVGIASRSANLVFAYSPSLILPTQGEVSFFQGASLAGSLRLSPSFGIYASEAASYGRRTFSLISQGQSVAEAGTGQTQPGQTQPGQTQPGSPTGTQTQTTGTGLQSVPQEIRTTNFVSSTSSIGANFSLTRLASAQISASYLISGGTDEESRAAIPLQRTLRFDLGSNYSISRLDGLATMAFATFSRFSDSSRANTASVIEMWTGRLSRWTTLRIGVGYGYTFSNTRVDLSTLSPNEAATAEKFKRVESHLPIGQVGVGHQIPSYERISLRADVAVTPVVDSINADAYPKLDAGVAGEWRYNVPLKFEVSASTGFSLAKSDQPRSSSLLLESKSTYRLARGLDLTAGLRFGWQRSTSRGVSASESGLGPPQTSTQYGIFLGAIFAERFAPGRTDELRPTSRANGSSGEF